MSLRGTSQTKSPYPSSVVESEKKSDAQQVHKDAGVPVLTPRVSSRQPKTKITGKITNKKAFDTDDSLESSEPQQIPGSTSSKGAGKIAASASEVKSEVVRNQIIFDPNENISKYIDEFNEKNFRANRQKHDDLVSKAINKEIKVQSVFTKDSAPHQVANSHLLKMGKTYLQRLKTLGVGWSPGAMDVAACLWLVDATIHSGDEMLKPFIELAVEFREKGLDLPSLIVNEAIKRDDTKFLQRLNQAFPNTNLIEIYRNGL